MKTGPFAEHSNALWNISGVHQWSKVNSGLIKMYKTEVRRSLQPETLHQFGISLWCMSYGTEVRELCSLQVLQKFPVIQHYLFGKVMSIEAVEADK